MQFVVKNTLTTCISVREIEATVIGRAFTGKFTVVFPCKDK